jgi:tetratricopeptide (TPR) repeat protein
MGRERTGKRQHLHVYLALCISAFAGLAGCAGWSSKQAGEQELHWAQASMDRGDYETALRQNRELFVLYPGTLGDEALFGMAMLYAHPLNPGADFSRAQEHFQRLQQLFPESRRAAEARIWMPILQDLAETRDKAVRLEGQVLELQGLLREKEVGSGALRTEIRKRDTEIAEMKRQIRSLEENLRRLQEQLQWLKGVDLGIEKKRREMVPR